MLSPTCGRDPLSGLDRPTETQSVAWSLSLFVDLWVPGAGAVPPFWAFLAFRRPSGGSIGLWGRSAGEASGFGGGAAFGPAFFLSLRSCTLGLGEL